MFSRALLHNIRFYVLIFSIILSAGIYFWAILSFDSLRLQIIRLTQIYSLTAVGYLYLTLLAGPFCYTFKGLPFRSQYIKARRALGVSAFYFALLHACFAFFGQLGGFEGLFFLSNKYLLAISLSFTALVILAIMTVTAFDSVIEKLTFPKWKMLHRLVYLAGIFILIHALMLGTHFQDLTESIPQVFLTALAFLLFLELLRIDAFLKKNFPNTKHISFISLPLFVLFFFAVLYLLIPFPDAAPVSFGIHSQHIQIAREAQKGTGLNTNLPNLPGIRGDRTKRYTVSFIKPEIIEPNVAVELKFEIFNASTGNQEFVFEKIYDKYMHLIVVDNSLTYFNHIHPESDGKGFTITTTFPTGGNYHLYTDFQPYGAIEQQVAFTVDVKGDAQAVGANQSVDTKLVKEFGEFEVGLAYPKPLRTADLSIGRQLLTFTIKDAKTKSPTTTLQPYLASFGHLVMINQKTYDYIHVHPTNRSAPKPEERSGPDVEFMPLGLYGPIKPGIYRVFAQFNPDGKLFTADFTIEVE